MKCEKCGSENVIEGVLSQGMGAVIFTTEKSLKRIAFSKNYSMVKANACKNCGYIFALKLADPENINPKK